MDEFIQQLKELTDEVFNKIDSLTFEELYEFVQQREVILNKIKALNLTSSEFKKQKGTVECILQQDAKILVRMETLKSDASQVINKISSRRQQKNAYDITYSMDGVYFDKKK